VLTNFDFGWHIPKGNLAQVAYKQQGAEGNGLLTTFLACWKFDNYAALDVWENGTIGFMAQDLTAF